MADIFHDLLVKASVERVFEAVSTPQGLDHWWTKRSAGEPKLGANYELGFGPNYEWRARVTACVPNSAFELQITRADADWTGTLVGFRFKSAGTNTNALFYHTGWPSQNEHWRVSCYCWAMYLRILRRYIEHGESVPYENRLDV